MPPRGGKPAQTRWSQRSSNPGGRQTKRAEEGAAHDIELLQEEGEEEKEKSQDEEEQKSVAYQMEEEPECGDWEGGELESVGQFIPQEKKKRRRRR